MRRRWRWRWTARAGWTGRSGPLPRPSSCGARTGRCRSRQRLRPWPHPTRPRPRSWPRAGRQRRTGCPGWALPSCRCLPWLQYSAFTAWTTQPSPCRPADLRHHQASTRSDREQLLTVSPTRARAAVLDEICAQAVDLARAAALEMAGADGVGEHVGMQADGERVVTHLFAWQDRAYVGWRWAVTVTRASRAKAVTVSEVVLLPGPEALLAPDWVPWSERVRPGDLGVGDLMPAAADDDRLVPAALLEGDDGVLDWDDSETWQTIGAARDIEVTLGITPDDG